MQLISHNVQSAHSMMQHQAHLEGEEGFLCQFLDARPDECILPAMHYRRRADDIFHGLWHLLRLGHKPYRNLQQSNVESLTAAETERYRKAYRSFREEMMSKYATPPAAQAAAKARAEPSDQPLNGQTSS